MPESSGPSKSNFHLAADPALGRIRQEMEALARNSIRLWPTPCMEDEIPIGASKLGGKPDLPLDLEWPHLVGTPDEGIILPFIGQFNLEELARYDVDNVLPQTGMLYLFFYDIFYSDTGKIRVFHRQIAKEQLSRRDLPIGDRFSTIGQAQAYDPCKLQFTTERMLPKGEDCWLDPGGTIGNSNVIMTTEEYSRWGRINYDFRLKYGEVHHMLGYPDLCSHGVEVPYELFPGYETSIEERVARTQDHRLLLQLGDTMWDLMGFKIGRTIYFCMRNQDLARGDFSRVWVDIE